MVDLVVRVQPKLEDVLCAHGHPLEEERGPVGGDHGVDGGLGETRPSRGSSILSRAAISIAKQRRNIGRKAGAHDGRAREIRPGAVASIEGALGPGRIRWSRWIGSMRPTTPRCHARHRPRSSRWGPWPGSPCTPPSPPARPRPAGISRNRSTACLLQGIAGDTNPTSQAPRRGARPLVGKRGALVGFPGRAGSPHP